MTNHQRHEPTWPFLIILVILFILSATSPRAWRIVERPDPPRPKQKPELALASAAQRTPHTTKPHESTTERSPLSPIQKDHTQPAAESALGGSSSSVTSFQPDGFSQSREGFSQLDVQQPIGKNGDQSEAPLGMREPTGDLVSELSGNYAQEMAEFAAESHEPCHEAEAPQTVADATDAQAHDAVAKGNAWTVPESLLVLLDSLANVEALRPWVTTVRNQVERLGTAFEQDSLEVALVLDELQRCIDRSSDLQMSLGEDSQLAAQFRQVRYALIRRLALWKSVHLAGGLNAELAKTHDADWQRLSQKIAALNARLGEGSTAQAWREFLNVEAVSEIARAARANPSDCSKWESQLNQVARDSLARIGRQELTPEQHALLQEPALEDYLNELRFWQGQSLTGAELLRVVEAFETRGLVSDGEAVLSHYYRLSRSSEEPSRWIGQCLNYLYRNANLRIVITADLLNRLLPQRPREYRPVSETILNRPVYGSSLAETTVAFRLIPDRQRARLALIVRGEVTSLTYAQAGPATVWNDGFGRYVAEKAIEITPRGLRAEPAVIDVQNDVRLRDVSTSLDSVPVLGFLTQEIARDQVARRRLEANEEARWKLAAQALREIENETESRFEELNERLARDVLGPLYSLNMSPKWVAAETTNDRIILRIHLGSAMQPGGHTLRPFALSHSLASCQIHESTVNNFLAQLHLEGQTFSIAELQTKLREKLRLPDLDSPEDNPHAHAQITFAAKDAVRVEFRDGRLNVLLSIARLVSSPNRWENFQVRAIYKPEISHDRIQFVRDGVIQLVGPMDMRSQIALRGVFSKTFSKERPWQVSPGFLEKNPHLADLTVTELTLEHGWLGFSIGTRSAQVNQTANRLPASSPSPYGS